MVTSLYEILIIDDTQANINLVKGILERHGSYRCKSFKDPLKAAAYIANNQFDLALIDYNMPQMNGIELIHFIRRQDHCRYQPLIMLTSAKEMSYDAFDAGANDFLSRPFDHSELLARIQNHLSSWDKYKQLEAYAQGLEETIRSVTKKLKNSEDTFSLVLEGSSDGIWDWDITNRSIRYSTSWAHSIGFTEAEIPPIIASWLNRVHPEDIDKLLLALDNNIHKDNNPLQCEYRLRHRNGHYLWMLCRGNAIRREGGVATRMAGSQMDISHLKMIQAQLTQSAFHDQLTGLPNRALFLERLDRAFVRYRRDPEQQFAVVFIDFDKYKSINDTYGHTFGDELLKKITPRLLSCCREMDTVARLGGDEFVILLNEIESIEDVHLFINRLMKTVSKPLLLSGIEVIPSISVGVTISDPRYRAANSLIKDADVALYHAKKSGRAQCVFFEPNLLTPLPRMLEIKTSLSKALRNNEFKMFYQPIFELRTQKMVGLEALIRWQHPKFGLMSPDDFIPIAEEDHAIVTLGKFGVSNCFQQMALWNQQYPQIKNCNLSLNFSKRQVLQKDFTTHLMGSALRHNLDPNIITLELSEIDFMAIEIQHPQLLWKLKKAGFKIGLDNYGDNTSLLSTLVRYPFDLIKIDRTLVLNLDKQEENLRLFNLLSTLSRDMKMTTVVKGIQTQEIYEQAVQANYRLGQGFYFARPVPAEGIDAFLDNNQLDILKQAKWA